MEYDPAVSTHKASSITSTTSTSSNSTWDHPISTPNYIHSTIIKTEDGMKQQPYEEYHFDSTLVADRISIPAFDYAEESNNFHFHDKQFITNTRSNDTDTHHTNTNDKNLNTNIRKENHEKITDHGKDQLHNNVTHDTMYASSYGQQQQPTPIYLQHGDQITVPSISMIHHSRKRSSSSSSSNDLYALQQQPRPIRPNNSSSSSTTEALNNQQQQQHRQQQRSQSPSTTCGSKRSKLNRDLLTDDEKRVNHIASEQKRRNTIRMGFKEMTDIIPTLKNVNNSKSTILFKAVEYIKHLDKRNRGLREKISSLQVRMKVEGRLAEHQSKYYRNTASVSSNAERYNKVFGINPQQQQQQQNAYNYSSHTSNTTSTSADNFSHLPPHTVSALLAHKNQQRQLEELQEQLRMQQQLLAKHNIITPKPRYHDAVTNDETTSYVQQQQSPLLLPNNSSNREQQQQQKQQQQQHQYHSISIPSSRSSNSEENDHIMPYPSTNSFIVPQDPNEQHQQHEKITTRRRPWHDRN